MKWFDMIVERLRDYSDGEIWSEGTEILCKNESVANAICDLLRQLYSSDGMDINLITGFYDPEEDKRNGEEDRFTGWWYVSIN